jgi:hypothetical protein
MSNIASPPVTLPKYEWPEAWRKPSTGTGAVKLARPQQTGRKGIVVSRAQEAGRSSNPNNTVAKNPARCSPLLVSANATDSKVNGMLGSQLSGVSS